ncbi:MAG: hypothetical protein ACRDXE_07145, partial [Acidimicrobiales bacterium]
MSSTAPARATARTGGSHDGRRTLVAPVLLLVGAGVYALVVGVAGLTFYLTPLLVGSVAVVAGLASRNRHLIPAGLPIMGWGVAAALFHYGEISAARTAPAYMVGIAAGMVVARVVGPRSEQGQWLTTAAISALVGGVAYYVEFDVPALGRWPAWCLSLVAWAIWETVRA